MELHRAILFFALSMRLMLSPTQELWAQSTEQPAAPAFTLAAGTIVRLRSTQEVNSKHVKMGDTLPLEVMRDVTVGDLLVVAKHTPVVATITERHTPRGMRPDSLVLEVKTVKDINGSPIAVTATQKQTGPHDRQIDLYTETVLSVGFFAPLLFLHGDEAVMPRGTEIDAAVSQDVLLNLSALTQRGKVLEAERAAARDQSRTGLSTIHLYLHYRPVAGQKHRVRHDGESHTVLLDAQKLVKLRDWSFYDVRVAPGRHIVACQGRKLELDTQTDEQYYVSIVQEHPQLRLREVWVPSLRDLWVPGLADPDTGEEQMYPLIPAITKDVYLNPK